MKALVFFLILGQADGFATGDNDYGSTLVLVPAPFESREECEAQGEAARAHNQGLSFLSYVCVGAPEDAHSQGT